MSAQDIPEWFKDEMSVFLLQKGYSENDWSYDEITDGMVHAFKLLSIPTNAAKIPEVAKLVETLHFYANEMNYSHDDYRGISGEMITRCVLYADLEERNDVYRYAGLRARQALQKFKEGE